MTPEEFQTIVLQRFDRIDQRFEKVDQSLSALHLLHKHQIQQINKLFSSLRKADEALAQRMDAIDDRVGLIETRLDRIEP